MSKAFTKEDDGAPEVEVRRHRIPVPQGVPNYLTATGARALRQELSDLGAMTTRAPDSDLRMQELAEHLATAELIEPEPAPDRVRFGNTVELDDGSRYRIVGVIEADPRAGAISWLSPVAKALLGARIGDPVTLPRGGERELVSIT